MMEELGKFITMDNYEAASDWRCGDDTGIASSGETTDSPQTSLARWYVKERVS